MLLSSVATLLGKPSPEVKPGGKSPEVKAGGNRTSESGTSESVRNVRVRTSESGNH